MVPSSATRLRPLLAGLAVVVLVGCTQRGTDAAPPSSAAPLPTMPSSTPRGWLPPYEEDELRRSFDPPLRTLDLTLTRAYVDANADDYVDPPRTDTVTDVNLALYATPTRGFNGDDYARRFWPLVAFLAKDVFDRWPGLASFDICQEQSAEGEDPITQVAVTRDAAKRIDWSSATPEQLIAESRRPDSGVTVRIGPPASSSALLPATTPTT